MTRGGGVQLLNHMPRLNQRGVIQFIVLLILAVGLVAGVYLVQQTQIFKPKASVSGPVSPQTSFSLLTQLESYKVGDTIEVKLVVRSDIDAANLFAAKINYDPQFLQLGRVDVTSFVTNWVEQYWGDPDKISLVGGVPAPGFQSQTNSAPAKMASLYFTALKAGNTTISFDDTSAIYRNSDNLNILGIKNNATIKITSGAPSAPIPAPTTKPSPSPFPTSTPRPSATPIPGTGDGNKDGKINLADMSVLLTDFNKESGFRVNIDMNGDGKINTFDFALMRNLLIQRGVIKG